MSVPVNTQYCVNESLISAFVKAAYLQNQALANPDGVSSDVRLSSIMLSKACMSKIVCPCLLAHSLVSPNLMVSPPKRKRRKKRKRKGNNTSISILQSVVR